MIGSEGNPDIDRGTGAEFSGGDLERPVRSEGGLRPLLFKAASMTAILVLISAALIVRQPFEGAVVELDASWVVSLSHQLHHGQVSGRDFSYTYGPLSQVIAALAVKLHIADDSLSSVGLVHLLFKLLGLGVFAVLIASVSRLDWCRSAIAMGSVWITGTLAAYFAFRPLSVLLVATVAAWAVAAEDRHSQRVLAAAAGVACFVGQLLTGELLIYGVVAVVAFVVVDTAIESLPFGKGPSGRRGRLLASRGLLLVSFLATVTVLNVLLDLVFLLTARGTYEPLSYLRSVSEMITGYASTMTIGWTLDLKATAALSALVAWTGAVIVWRRFQSSSVHERLLLSWAIAATLLLKSSLVRSDLGHIALGFTPWIVVVVVAHLSWADTVRTCAGAMLAISSLITIWPLADLANWRAAWGVLAGTDRPVKRLSALRTWQVARTAMVPGALRQWAEAPGARLAVVPYQNQVAVALDMTLVSPILQAYAAHTESQQRRFVTGLERAGEDVHVLWGIDGRASILLDHVQTAARVPVIFEHLAGTFRDTGLLPVDSDYVLLERRATPAVLARVPVETTRAGAGALCERDSRVVVARDTAECGIVALRVRAQYPFTSRALKPEELWVRVRLEGAEVAATRVVPLTPSGVWETMISVAPSSQVAGVFRGVAPTSSWDTVVIESVPSAFAVAPRVLAIDAVWCVELAEPARSGHGTAFDQ